MRHFTARTGVLVLDVVLVATQAVESFGFLQVGKEETKAIGEIWVGIIHL